MASECLKRKKETIRQRLNRLASVPRNAAKAAIKEFLNNLCIVITAQLAILRPILELHTILLENFILFPLDAVTATIQNTTSTIRAPLRNIGIDSECPDTNVASKAINTLFIPLEALGNGLENSGDAIREFIESERKRLDDLGTFCDIKDEFDDL